MLEVMPSPHEQEEYFLRQRECFSAKKRLEDFRRFAEALTTLTDTPEVRALIEREIARLEYALAAAELRWETFLAEHSDKSFRVFSPDRVRDSISADVKPLGLGDDEERGGGKR